jgi:hypothetical protein
MGGYPEGLSRTDPEINRANKHRRVHEASAHAALVFDEQGHVQGGASTGTPTSLRGSSTAAPTKRNHHHGRIGGFSASTLIPATAGGASHAPRSRVRLRRSPNVAADVSRPSRKSRPDVGRTAGFCSAPPSSSSSATASAAGGNSANTPTWSAGSSNRRRRPAHPTRGEVRQLPLLRSGSSKAGVVALVGIEHEAGAREQAGRWVDDRDVASDCLTQVDGEVAVPATGDDHVRAAIAAGI